MPFLEIDLWKGFDPKKKEVLVAKVTDVVTEVVDCPKEAVHIIIREEPKENWAVGGVQLSKKFGSA
ncbi:MAG: 2-hydroxymuconate tautomerase family protein [candidate division WOR-3 bacterium]|nr:MAG: 2-hydroxymuconate tautomerase family protein [candidate division WOR-3 bacterium]